MSTINCGVTAGKVFTPDGEGIFEITPTGLNLLGVPAVQVDLTDGVAAEDIQDDAVTPVGKIAEMTEDGIQVRRVARATYDFDDDGGGQTAHGLGVTLPKYAVITRTWFEVVDAITGDAGTKFSIDSEGTGDILAAEDIATAGTEGFHDGIQHGPAEHFVKTTAAREIKLTPSVHNITGGRLIVFVEYSVTE